MTAAQAAVDQDVRAEYLRQAACYRNLALDLMRRGPGEQAAFSLLGKDDPCCSDCASDRQRRAG